MAKPTESEEKGGSFDLDRFRKLLQLMEKYGVTEVNLQNDAESWKVRRGPRTVQYEAPPQQFTMPQMMNPAAMSPMTSGTVSGSPEKPVGITINAPTVGTFYTSASPEDEPFVTVGSSVTPESVVCIIEAMKVFNQINAEKSGRIVEILVENGAAVEFGQPLFRLEP